MCGRYTLQPGDKFYDRFDIENRLETLTPRYNIAPGQMVPVVISKSPNRVVIMKWGLIPHWAKEEKIGYKMINARVETLGEKPSYRGSLKNKRCLVPASGFYEWQVTKLGKIPHYIHPDDNSLIAFAGLYDVWLKDGKEVYTFTIVTTNANAFMKKIHDRMPVVLGRGKERQWLNKDLEDPSKALELLHDVGANALAEYEVSRKVNKPQNDTPAVILPARKFIA